MPNRALIIALVLVIILGLYVYVPRLIHKQPRPQPVAAQPQPSPLPEPTPSPSPTPEPETHFDVLDDQNAVRRLASLDWGESPFEILLPDVHLVAPLPTTAGEEALPLTPLALHAIYSGTQGNIANINGVLVRVGDVIADATVLSISVKRRLVEVRRQNGSIEILRVFPSD